VHATEQGRAIAAVEQIRTAAEMLAWCEEYGVDPEALEGQLAT
jgi:hypothetical protein